MAEKSETSRIEAFCDGVFAIAITLLILEIHIPPLSTVHSNEELQQKLLDDWPSWFGFLLSFTIILIAWVNHHGAFKLIDKSSPQFVYANGFMLLTVAILPFSTGLMAEYLNTDFVRPAINFYCFSILLHNVSWVIWGRTLTHPYSLAMDEQAGKSLYINLVKNSIPAFFIYLGICILSFWFPITAMVMMTASWIVWVVTSIILIPKR